MSQDQKVNMVWLGLSDEPHKQYYEKWSKTEKPVTYTNWDKNEPNAISGQDFECLTMYRAHGKWNDEGCDRHTGLQISTKKFLAKISTKNFDLKFRPKISTKTFNLKFRPKISTKTFEQKC